MKKLLLILLLLLSGCVIKQGMNPEDPYEPINRKIHNFNMKFDERILKPPAKLYSAVLPLSVQTGITNFYSNLNLLPTVANDLLQGELLIGYKDAWRFLINSSLGLAGLLDVAKTMGLPFHSNDLGITFAKWGDKDSPYIVLPFFGPSTIRDAVGVTFDYGVFTIYPYINPFAIRYGIIGLHYVQLRADFLHKESIIDEALDEYTFIRDVYLQNREYQIDNENPDEISAESLYIESEEPPDDQLSLNTHTSP